MLAPFYRFSMRAIAHRVTRISSSIRVGVIVIYNLMQSLPAGTPLPFAIRL